MFLLQLKVTKLTKRILRNEFLSSILKRAEGLKQRNRHFFYFCNISLKYLTGVFCQFFVVLVQQA